MNATASPHFSLVDEPSYTFRSADNVRAYERELNFAECNRPASVHGLLVEGKPYAVLGADGGCSAVHEHSMLLLADHIYIAIGDQLACLGADSLELQWRLKVDDATCFGLHFSAKHNALISHGELSVARVAPEGKIIWQAYGADIFSEGFCLESDFILVRDFEGRVYRFNYQSGRNDA